MGSVYYGWAQDADPADYMTMDMFVHDWEVMRRRERQTRGDMRDGQLAFNMLFNLRPDLSEQIRAVRGLDPFYMDDNLEAFWSWLAEHWEGPNDDD